MNKTLLIIFSYIVFLDDADSCLDSGGCWDSFDKICRHKEEYAQLLCHRDSLLACNLDQLCKEGFSCVSVNSLGKSYCIQKSDICPYLCSKRSCNIMESYPLQVSCEDQE